MDLSLIVVLSLAAWRLSRIVPADKVAEPLNNWLMMWAFTGDGGKWRRAVHDHVTCTLCFSLTVSGGVTAAWGLIDGWLGWAFLWQWAAVWGGASFLALVADRA